jgi:hypothetical protein
MHSVHKVNMYFVFLNQKRLFSLYSINHLIIVTEMRCVLFELELHFFKYYLDETHASDG